MSGNTFTQYEVDDDLRCSMFIDLDCQCPNVATRVVREPYTPAGFGVQCCDECAAGQINFGYYTDSERDAELAKKRAQRFALTVFNPDFNHTVQLSYLESLMAQTVHLEAA